jgi:glycosyltransferase involved in cell wall biosynthesis
MTRSVSVLIFTLNEEKNIDACLESVGWSDDIHVLDSYSNDRTVEMAQAFGARITRRQFDNWSEHQNWALRNIEFKHKWVFYLDADERMTPESVKAVEQAVADPQGHVAFRIRRRDYFMDTWLRNVQATSFYQRLFIPEKMHYERLVNPVSVPQGTVGEIGGHLDHFPFSKGLADWLQRHNRYSDFEAQQIISERINEQPFSLSKAFLAKDFHVRRYHQKQLFHRAPARPLIKFVLLYVLKRGFLDGRPGFVYAILQSFYEYMIVLKTNEIEKHQPYMMMEKHPTAMPFVQPIASAPGDEN